MPTGVAENGWVMRFIAAVGFLILASTASANPAPDLAPAPAWVKRVPFVVPTARGDAPVRILLSDEQVSLSRGRVERFVEAAAIVQTAAGLSAGNITIPWRPDFDTLTIHELSLRRSGKVIDVLTSGQKFTVIRRESNLEAATFDGQLTATLQIEGVEVGDVIDLAMTIVSRDPTLGNHVEQLLANWNGVAIDRAHLRLQWDRDVPLRLRQTGGLPVLKPVAAGAGRAIELTLDNVQPIIPPKGAPQRFAQGRMIEATDFRDWSELSALFAPLYVKAATIDPNGPVAAQIAAIRARSTDPVTRAEAALALVQDQIRYVAVQMGTGGYVPVGADATWANRFGDCKAKTALLLAILQRLDVTAVPVLVSVRAGDGIDARLPMAGLFDHVLVRATIGGKDYWLDGTRSGDHRLANLETPDFRWGLPLAASGARLVALRRQPRTAPEVDLALDIDARSGIYAPAPAQAVTTYRGDSAQSVKLTLAALAESARDAALRDFWKDTYPFIVPDQVSAVYDPATGTERLSMSGTARLKWDDDYWRIPGSSLAFRADFDRPAGPARDAPFATNYPGFTRSTATVKLPAGVDLWRGEVGHDVDQTLAGVVYHREAAIRDKVLRMVKTERHIAPEVPAAEARAAAPRLTALNDEDVHLQKGDYFATDADLTALLATTPGTASAAMDRGVLLLDRNRFDEAIIDFTKVHALEPGNAYALANRGLAHAWKNNLTQATTDLAAASVLDPGNAVAARGRGVVAMKQGDPAAAIDAFTVSLVKAPENQFALIRRAQLYFQMGKTEAALADTNTLLRLDPGALNTLALRANIYIAEGKDDLALAEVAALQQAHPRDASAAAAAAQLYATLKKTALALAAIDAALAIKPQASLYLHRHFVRDPADVAGRRGDLDQALKLEPGYPNALIAKGDLAFEQGEYRAAAAVYTALLKDHPKLTHALVARGTALTKAGDPTAGKRDFVAAAALATTPSDYNSLCWGKATRGVALELALDECSRAVKLAPRDAAILDSRGLVNLRLGRLDAAIADYDLALSINPTLAPSLYGRAVARSRTGDAARATLDRDAAERSHRGITAEFKGYGIDRP